MLLFKLRKVILPFFSNTDKQQVFQTHKFFPLLILNLAFLRIIEMSHTLKKCRPGLS